MKASEIKALRVKCRMLPGGDIIDAFTDEKAAQICNGIGAAWIDRLAPFASRILNRSFPWAIQASVIHDLRYNLAFFGYRGRLKADADFLTGCIIGIDEAGGCFMTKFLRCQRALAMFMILRKYGAFAWEGNCND